MEKESETPRLINMIYKTVFQENLSDIPQFNEHMRSKEEIMKDYGLEV